MRLIHSLWWRSRAVAAIAFAATFTVPAFATSPGAPSESDSNNGAPTAQRYMQPDLDVLQGERFEREILSLEGRNEWSRIEWRDSVAQAIADAKKSQKPIFVLMTVAEFGKDHSAFT